MEKILRFPITCTGILFNSVKLGTSLELEPAHTNNQIHVLIILKLNTVVHHISLHFA